MSIRKPHRTIQNGSPTDISLVPGTSRRRDAEEEKYFAPPPQYFWIFECHSMTALRFDAFNAQHFYQTTPSQIFESSSSRVGSRSDRQTSASVREH